VIRYYRKQICPRLLPFLNISNFLVVRIPVVDDDHRADDFVPP
jgi:hypothetical protein